jgi:hypothetical protein
MKENAYRSNQGHSSLIFFSFCPFPFSGPWFFGEIIDGKLGCCFSFGIFVNGHFLQGSLTFIVGILQVRNQKYNLRTSWPCWTNCLTVMN